MGKRGATRLEMARRAPWAVACECLDSSGRGAPDESKRRGACLGPDGEDRAARLSNHSEGLRVRGVTGEGPLPFRANDDQVSGVLPGKAEDLPDRFAVCQVKF